MHSFTHDDALSTDPVFALLHLHGSDLLTSAGMQIEKSLSHHGSISCYDHSVAVARMSIYLALKLRVRVDMRSMIRGALLHDYFLYDWRDGEAGHDLHGFKHARRALLNAERDFELSAIARDVIVKHMFPLNITPPRYRETVFVTVADKVCAVREFSKSVWWMLPVVRRKHA